MMIIETLKVTKNVITVDGATEKEKEISQYMANNVINVVERTTSRLCVSPVTVDLSQSVTQEGQMEPDKTQINACTHAMCMRLRSVRMTWKTSQNRSSHCFIIENHRDFWEQFKFAPNS